MGMKQAMPITSKKNESFTRKGSTEEHRDKVPVMQSGAVVPVDLQAVDIESLVGERSIWREERYIDIIPTAAATAEVISGTVGNHASNKGDTEGNDTRDEEGMDRGNTRQ